MSEAIKIRAHRQGEVTELRILLTHPMETGQRRDERGQIVPAHYIQSFAVRQNGKALIDGQLNTSVSRNPLFAFRALGIRSGDRISVHWTDNSGDQRSDEITVS